MLKSIGFFVGGILFAAIAGFMSMGSLMFTEHESQFGVEETAARLQANIQTAGWDLSGLRSPTRAIKSKGADAPNVLLVEACNTDYSKPIINERDTRILSILMPCTIAVYEGGDGKTYIGTMNSGLMGWMFGVKVGNIMSNVARDQKTFLQFDPSKPAPKLIESAPGGGGGGAAVGGGC